MYNSPFNSESYNDEIPVFHFRVYLSEIWEKNSTSVTRKQVQNPYFPLKCFIFSFCQTVYRYKWFSLIMQLKFRFFKGIVIEYIISKKTRFCCVYEKTCYGPIAKMLFLNMLYNHGKLCACIIKCTIAL